MGVNLGMEIIDTSRSYDHAKYLHVPVYLLNFFINDGFAVNNQFRYTP